MAGKEEKEEKAGKAGEERKRRYLLAFSSLLSPASPSLSFLKLRGMGTGNKNTAALRRSTQTFFSPFLLSLVVVQTFFPS